MSGGPDSPSESGRRAPATLLLAVAAISLVPRLWLAAHRPLSHNGAWHLFAARFFRQELGTIAHPPLFLLLLKACDRVSRSLLSYRLVPLAAGVGSVILVGLILDRLGCVPAASALGALAIALSTTAIALSVQVEGFTLAVAFVLAAFLFALDLFRMDAPPPFGRRAGFAICASLALMTEYLSGLFLIAVVLAPLLAAILRPDYRRRLLGALPRRIAADALTLLPPALVGAALYRFLASSWIRMLSGPASGLPRFYFRPGAESAGAFLARTFSATANLDSPVALAPRAALTVLALFLAVAILAPATERPPAGRGVERLFPALVLTLLLAIGAALGYLGRYPFGGTHRHQILILYFAVLAGAIAFDRLVRMAPPPGRLALGALGAAAIGLAAFHNRSAQIFRDEPMNVRAGIFAKNLGGPGTGVVHFDQLNFIALFMDFYQWDCRSAGRVSESPPADRYEFSRGDRHFTAIYHRFLFLMDFRSPALYAELRATFGAVGPACQTAFSVNRNLFTGPHTLRPEGEREDLQRQIPALASEAGLALRTITIDDDFVEVELCPRP